MTSGQIPERISAAEPVVESSLFASVLQQERRITLLIMILAIAAVFVDMAWQSAVPMAGPVDLVLQVAMGCAFLGILAWHTVNPNSHVQHSLLGIVVVGVVGQVGRMYVALFGYGWNNPPDLSLPTALGYIPLLVVATFAFLPQREAVRWGGGLMLIVMLPTAIYVSSHLDLMANSPRLIDLMHMALLQTPLTFLLGVLISRVTALVQIHSDFRDGSSEAQVMETDASTMTFNRAGLDRVLEEAIEQAKLTHQEMTLGYLELSATLVEQQLEDKLRQAVSLLREELPSERLVLGRWSSARLMFVLNGETVASASRACQIVLERINRDAAAPEDRPASIGLAAYHPGETLAGLVKRADDRLQDARHSSGLGLAFSGGDAF